MALRRVYGAAKTMIDKCAPNANLAPARTPRILWVELTSKCPFDCVFCSRKTLRGAGQHMPWPLYESLVRQVAHPRIFRLNYSGESTVYPDLIRAIGLAHATGAFVELVSALASASDAMIGELAASGLDRLTVSLHTTAPAQYDAIYRYGSWETLHARLARFAALCRDQPRPPILDFAFVAMDRNLTDLDGVAALADSLGVQNISIFPVIRRDEIPVPFPAELTMLGEPRGAFIERVRTAAARAMQDHPGVGLAIANPLFDTAEPCLGAAPRPYPWPLPAGACIHSCEQNPWETAHVLANGDVVACEVLDREPLGNLARQSLDEIWNGEPYRRFRQRYRAGEIAACRTCPWKTAFVPAPIESVILAERGPSAQLLHGWHPPSANDGHIWSSQESAALLAAPAASAVIHVSGILPPSNDLTVLSCGSPIGRVVNRGAENLPFGLDFPAEGDPAEPWPIEFRTRHIHRAPGDQRDLGFALFLMAAKPAVDPSALASRHAALGRLRKIIRAADALSGPPRPIATGRLPLEPGLSILVPERDNPEELAACLEAARQAALRWIRESAEPVETIVVVNGSPAARYRALQVEYPCVHWQFHGRALGFSGAVAAGLRGVRFDWVYLLNNDAILDPDALAAVAPLRDEGTFSIASQIFLRDPTRFRDETNWTALLLEDGLATIHDCIPHSAAAVEGFYAGGGASLFQTALLRRLLDPSVYHPFYWEDVEWGWRARKLGYRSLFCPASTARHTRRGTIARLYPTREIEAVTQRHRLLFQLRNFTRIGSLDHALDAIARLPEWQFFLDWRTVGRIIRGRLWNRRAPIEDRQVLSGRM